MKTQLLTVLSLLPAACEGLRFDRKTNASGIIGGDYHMKLSNFRNVQYTGELTVGEQTLPVIYDTGSFEVIVLSTLCAQCTGGTAVIYDHLKSASYQGTTIVTEHLFGSGAVVSEKGYESVHMGGVSSQYIAPNMSFWQVMDHGIPVWGKNAVFSGIVGLGFPNTIPEGYGHEGSRDSTFLKALNVNKFGLCLERSGYGAPGWMTIEPSLTPGMFRSVAVKGQVHWAVPMGSFRAEGVSAPDPCQPSCGAILDSGTSLIAVPPQARGLVNALKSMIKSDCSNLHTLPSLHFDLDGLPLELPPHAYVMQENGMCMPAFMDIDKQSQLGPVFILGMPFLRYYMTVFDKWNMQVHLAEVSSTCQVTGAPGSMFGGFANVSNFSHDLVSTANASHFGTATGRMASGTRVYSSEDFWPTQADLKSARLPPWASSNTSQNLQI